MPSFNRVIVMGNLTRDPDVREVGVNAVKVCRFSVAMNERRKDRDTFGYFLDIADIFVNDYFSGHQSDDESWSSLLKTAADKNFDFTSFLQTISETRDALNRSANIGLLTDQMLNKMMGGAS